MNKENKRVIFVLVGFCLMFISLIIYLVLTTLFTNTFLLFNMFAFIFYISPYTKEKNYGGEIL